MLSNPHISDNPRHAPSHSGFTLVEILLVILIITTLSVAGFSSVVNLQKSAKAREVKNKIIDMIELARSFAINGRQEKGCGAGGGKIVPTEYRVQFGSNKILGSNPPEMKQTVYLVAYQEGCNDSYLNGSSDTYIIPKPYGFSINGKKDTPLVKFKYSSPFADFSSDIKSPKISIDIYDNNLATNPSGTKPLQTITLYDKIGIPE